jgi:hypothetical protein
LTSLIQCAAHLLDRCFAPAIFGDLCVAPPLRRWDLSNQPEIATLKLSRGELLGGDPAPTSPSRTLGRWSPSGSPCTGNSPASKRSKLLLQFTNLKAAVDVGRGNPAGPDELLQNIL